MDSSCDEFFSGTGFALNENRSVCGRDGANLLKDQMQGLAVTDQLPDALNTQVASCFE